MIKFLFFTLIFIVPLNASWQGEYWQNGIWTQAKNNVFRLYAVVELRANKMSKFYHLKLGENIAYHALPNLDLELHYSYLYTKSFGASSFKNRNRLELEINPSAPISDAALVKWRNRLEWIKVQGDSKIYTVFRHRTAIIFSLENWGKLTSFRMSDEVFYDFAANKFTQNRLIPMQLSFALSKHTSLDVFFMIRRVFSFGLNQWYGSYILGSEFSF